MHEYKSGAKAKKILKGIANTILAIGAVGWFGGFLLAIRPGIIPTWLELPLGDLQSVAVDSNGRIYCGLGSYGRVQVYTYRGEFERGWSDGLLPSGMRLEIDSNDRLEVLVFKKNKRCVFNSDGKLLEETSLPLEEFTKQINQVGRPCRDSAGAVYFIRNTILFPHIEKRETNGREITIVRAPIYKWPFTAPMPAWLFFMGGILLHLFAERVGKLPHKQTPTPTQA